MTLSKPIGQSQDAPAKQTARLIELRSQPHLQWTNDFDRQQTHENLTFAESVERIASLFGETYRNAHLFTTAADVTARIGKSGDSRLTRTKASQQIDDQSRSHDRTKQYLIPDGQPCPFLEALGVMTSNGRVRKSKQHKFRQINRYLEFVDEVVDDLPAEGRIEVIDFGCGLSYLTFSLHHLLTVIRGRDVRIRGVDRNEAVIARCEQTAAELKLIGLEFQCEDIAESPESVDLAVSLHACDTATDDALAAAVRMEANVILAAPCCQHELFTQLDSDPLALITRHGILKERMAALATDALRAAVLEQHGYRTQVMEFIETEHTPKNLLLRAVRRATGAVHGEHSSRVDELKSLLGIDRTRLETLLMRP